VRSWTALSTRAAAAVVLAWALLSVAAAWRSAAARTSDEVTALEAEFQSLERVLPPAGTVGFLEYASDDSRADRVMVYYVAQYTLAPRLVEKRTDLEFLIVARDALRAGVDDRIADFVPIASSGRGHRVYQRRAE
jgi:hypothetical protein